MFIKGLKEASDLVVLLGLADDELDWDGHGDDDLLGDFEVLAGHELELLGEVASLAEG